MSRAETLREFADAALKLAAELEAESAAGVSDPAPESTPATEAAAEVVQALAEPEADSDKPGGVPETIGPAVSNGAQ